MWRRDFPVTRLQGQAIRHALSLLTTHPLLCDVLREYHAKAIVQLGEPVAVCLVVFGGLPAVDALIDQTKRKGMLDIKETDVHVGEEALHKVKADLSSMTCRLWYVKPSFCGGNKEDDPFRHEYIAELKKLAEERHFAVRPSFPILCTTSATHTQAAAKVNADGDADARDVAILMGIASSPICMDVDRERLAQIRQEILGTTKEDKGKA